MRSPDPYAVVRLLLSALVGLGPFALPIRVDGKWTVLVDVVVKGATQGFPLAVGFFSLALILAGAASSLRKRPGFDDGSIMLVIRVLALPLAALMLMGGGPLPGSTVGLMWGVLVASVAVIIPLGAAALDVLAAYGVLELVGGVMRPVMRPLFRLPGRAALDDLTSWLGSYSVGLYLTRRLTEQGRYTRREAMVIVTCFSTVSIGFVGVVASTLGLLSLFPVILLSYFVVVYLLAAILARTWPVTATPDRTLGEPDLETDAGPSLSLALERAAAGGPMPSVALRGAWAGLRLASGILGPILLIGTAALLLNDHTPLFQWLGRPLVPIIAALGLPDPDLLAPATVAGITEMYVPALMVKEAAAPGRFFICVLSISQLIFFSSVGPMMLAMFRDLPLRLSHLVALFFIRTALLVPLLAGLTWVLDRAGLFEGL